MKNNNIIRCFVGILISSLMSCLPDIAEDKKNTFYTDSHKASDIIRLPIIEPFELTNPVSLYHEAWYVDYPRDLGMEEINVSQEGLIPRSHKYICVLDSVFYTISLSEGDTCFWIYDIQNNYQFGSTTRVGFNTILKETHYPTPNHWYDVDNLWVDFNETRRLPWRTGQESLSPTDN
jgi:hypothetical protein